MFGLGIGIIFGNFQIWGMIFLLRDRLSIFVRYSSPLGPRCFKCLMFSPSGPVELVVLVDLRAAEVCAIVICMGVVGSDTIFLWSFL